MKIGIIGAGKMGHRWEKAVCDAGHVPILCDIGWGRSEVFGPSVGLIIVATPIGSLAENAIEALIKGKHVLIEKPGAAAAHELAAIRATAQEKEKLVRVGYNLRYHHAMFDAKERLEDIGPIMWIRGRYGHGGRPNYEKEWRLSCGVGQLLDQGVHLIDLAGFFCGPQSTLYSLESDLYWNAPSADNVFMILRSKNDQITTLHTSCTEWKNIFSFEIAGTEGKLEISGLGGSYGVERLTWYDDAKDGTAPTTKIEEYPYADRSLEFQLREFIEDIQRGREPNPGIKEAMNVMKVVEEIRS
jgi:predicted dehydrogenase